MNIRRRIRHLRRFMDSLSRSGLPGHEADVSQWLALLQHPFAWGLIYGQGCEARERFRRRRGAVAGARRPRSMEGVRRGDCWARD